MTTETLRIVQLNRTPQPSKNGGTYNRVNIMDDRGRQLSALGAWTDGWKIGDVINVVVESVTKNNSQGFPVIYLNMKDPNVAEKKSGTSGFYAKKDSLITFYDIASRLAPMIFPGQKIQMKDIDAIVESLKTRIDKEAGKSAQAVNQPMQPAQVQQPVQSIQQQVPIVNVEDETEDYVDL